MSGGKFTNNNMLIYCNPVGKAQNWPKSNDWRRFIEAMLNCKLQLQIHFTATREKVENFVVHCKVLAIKMKPTYVSSCESFENGFKCEELSHCVCLFGKLFNGR